MRTSLVVLVWLQVVSADAIAGGKTGVAECDEYLDKYEKCITSKVPKAGRAAMKSGLDQTRAAWRRAAADPVKRAALAENCVDAWHAAKAATASFKCDWSYPGTPTGAKALLSEFLQTGADHAALTAALKPTSADFQSVFATTKTAKKAEEVYSKLWEVVSKDPIRPKDGQTELKIWQATTDELKAGKGDAPNFPGGYRSAATHLKPRLTVYRWKFVKPGEALGMAFDGLYHVNGHWVLMPKPWRVRPDA